MSKTNLLPLLLLLSCGGPADSTKAPHRVLRQDLLRDADGDGVGDWDERARGRDHLMADVPQGRLPSVRRALLHGPRGEAIEVEARLERAWRSPLLRASHADGGRTELPLENRLSLPLWRLPEHWRALLTRSPFRAVQLESKGEGAADPLVRQGVEWRWTRTTQGLSSAVLPLTPSEITAGEAVLGSAHSEARVRALLRNAYRLVLSLPDEDRVFFLSPSLPPMEFLSSHFRVKRDLEGRVVALGGLEQTLPHPVAWDMPEGEGVWRTVNMDERWRTKARPGETYALVYATIGEVLSSLAKGARASAKPAEVPEARITLPKETLVTWVFHMPAPRRAKVEGGDKEAGTWRPDRVCVEQHRRLRGYVAAPFRRSQDFLNFWEVSTGGNWTQLGHWGRARISWEEHHATGSAVALELRLPNGTTVLRSSPSMARMRTRVGVLSPRCGGEARSQAIPLWRGLVQRDWWGAPW